MANYPARFIWLNGEYVEWPEAKIHVSTDTVLRAGNVFEGLRAYASPDRQQMFIFRLEEHLDRLWDSMKVMRIAGHSNWDRLLCEFLAKDLGQRHASPRQGRGQLSSEPPSFCAGQTRRLRQCHHVK